MHSHTPSSYPPMSPSTRAPRQYTLADWLKIPEEKRCELIQGKLVYQAMPGPIHGRIQGQIFSSYSPLYDQKPSHQDRPGGWWISLEVDLDLKGSGCRPDIVGWRRDRYPELPKPDKRGLVTDVPDWICEVLSNSTAHIDLGAKRKIYHQAGVEHYWVVDPQNYVFMVLRRSQEDYLTMLVAGRNEQVCVEPFHQIELSINRVFGEDEFIESTEETETE